MFGKRGRDAKRHCKDGRRRGRAAVSRLPPRRESLAVLLPMRLRLPQDHGREAPGLKGGKEGRRRRRRGRRRRNKEEEKLATCHVAEARCCPRRRAPCVASSLARDVRRRRRRAQLRLTQSSERVEWDLSSGKPGKEPRTSRLPLSSV